MRSHLTPDELTALVETGTASPAAERHLAACAECRREAEGLRALMADLRQADVPEPSPLFWEHLSARVADAVRQGPVAPAADGAGWRRRWSTWGWTLGGATVVAGLLVVAFVPGGPSVEPPPEAAGAAAAVEAPDAASDGEDWALIASAIDDLDYDDVRAIGASLPGPAELAVEELDASERSELARLLRDEIARLSPASLETL